MRPGFASGARFSRDRDYRLVRSYPTDNALSLIAQLHSLASHEPFRQLAGVAELAKCCRMHGPIVGQTDESRSRNRGQIRAVDDPENLVGESRGSDEQARISDIEPPSGIRQEHNGLGAINTLTRIVAPLPGARSRQPTRDTALRATRSRSTPRSQSLRPVRGARRAACRSSRPQRRDG
jgi:hypothetical protein